MWLHQEMDRFALMHLSAITNALIAATVTETSEIFNTILTVVSGFFLQPCIIY